MQHFLTLSGLTLELLLLLRLRRFNVTPVPKELMLNARQHLEHQDFEMQAKFDWWKKAEITDTLFEPCQRLKPSALRACQ